MNCDPSIVFPVPELPATITANPLGIPPSIKESRFGTPVDILLSRSKLFYGIMKIIIM
jgi:hypothetical protein